MLRLIFVFVIIIAGAIASLQGPFYALLFYLWNAYFRPEQWVWSNTVASLDLSLVIGAFLLVTSIGAVMREFKFTRTLVLILLFFAQSVVSLFVSENWAWSEQYWMEFFKVIVITLLIPVLVTDAKRYRLVLLVIGFSLGLEEAKQGWAQLILNPGAANNNPQVVLGDNNGVAMGMMMLVPVFVALAQTATKRWERYLHRFFIVGLFYRGISTYSRGGMLAALAIGFIALWRSPRRVRASISIAVLVGIVLLVMPPRFWDRMNTIMGGSSSAQMNEESEGRLYFWGIAVEMADAHPLTGVGFNDFRHFFNAYDTSGGVYGENRAVHSAWFGTLSEMGYPGLIFFIALIGSSFWTLSRVRASAHDDPAAREIGIYAAAMQMSLVAYVVGATFLNAQYNEMFWHFVGLCIALERIVALQPAARLATTTYVGAAARVPVNSRVSQGAMPIRSGGMLRRP